MAISLDFNKKNDGTEAASDWEILEVSEVLEFEFDPASVEQKVRRHRPVATLVCRRWVAGIIDAQADAILASDDLHSVGGAYRSHTFAGEDFDAALLSGAYAGDWTMIASGIYKKSNDSMAMEHREEWQAVGAWTEYTNDEGAGS